MTKYVPTEFNVKSEKTDFPEFKSKLDVKILKIDSQAQPKITQFTMSEFHAPHADLPDSIRARNSALDNGEIHEDLRPQKDRRFTLNPLLRDPLSIEQEERRLIGEKVRAQVEVLALDAKIEASAEGYQEGLEKGFKEAHEKVLAEGRVDLARFSELILSFENLKGEIFAANERFLIELIFRISKMLFLKELPVDTGYLLRLAKDLISRVGAKDHITLKISPDDSKLIDQLKEGLLQSLGPLSNLNIETSSDLKLGGCLLETEWNAIDAKVETQLDGLYRALIGRTVE